eukprot:9455592-Lingulodinium_polyedra.AAC.1
MVAFVALWQQQLLHLSTQHGSRSRQQQQHGVCGLCSHAARCFRRQEGGAGSFACDGALPPRSCRAAAPLVGKGGQAQRPPAPP